MLAVGPDGTVFVLMRIGEPYPYQYHYQVVRVARGGHRSVVSDLLDEAQGPTVIPADLTVKSDGTIVVLPHVTDGDAPLVEVARDGRRTVLSQLTDGRPLVELPSSIVESKSGSLLIVEPFGGPPSGLVIEVEDDGTRSVYRDLTDPGLGPGMSPADVAVQPDGELLILDYDAGTPLVEDGAFFSYGALLDVAADSTRTVRSDFGDPSQGPSFRSVKRLALVPEACGGRRIARAPGDRSGGAIDARQCSSSGPGSRLGTRR